MGLGLKRCTRDKNVFSSQEKLMKSVIKKEYPLDFSDYGEYILFNTLLHIHFMYCGLPAFEPFT